MDENVDPQTVSIFAKKQGEGEGGEGDLMDRDELIRRNMKWELIPPDSRELVVPFLSVQDNLLGLNVALTTKKDKLREELKKSYVKAVIPAFHTYPFTDKNDFETLRKVLEMGVTLQSISLTLYEDPPRRADGGVSDPDKVLWHLVRRKSDIAQVYVDKSPARDTRQNFLGFGVRSTFDLACEQGNVSVVAALLGKEKRTDMNQQRAGGGTPLFTAAKAGHTEIVALLVAAGADINKSEGDTDPFLRAASGGHVEIVTLLLKSAKAAGDKRYVDKASNMGNTAMFLACHGGYVRVMKVLLKAGADVNKYNEDGDSPVHEASFEGHVETVRMLIEAGADIHKADKDGLTPLYSATQAGHVDIVDLLIKAGANVTRTLPNGATPLSMCAEKGYICHQRIANLLLDAGAARLVDHAVHGGFTPLIMACRGGKVALARILLDSAGASIDRADNDGETALFHASKNGHVDVVRLLLEKGANAAGINTANVVQETPLYAAAAAGHVDVGRVLIEAGADVDRVASNGKTAEQVSERSELIIFIRKWKRDASRESDEAIARRSRASIETLTLMSQRDKPLDEQYEYYFPSSQSQPQPQPQPQPRALSQGQTQRATRALAQTQTLALACTIPAKYRPPLWYFDLQRDINARMRAILIDWLQDVIQRFYCDLYMYSCYKASPRMLWIAVYILDRVCTKLQIIRTQLQRLGMVVMIIASKLDGTTIDLSTWAQISDGATTSEELLATEVRVLQILDHEVLPPLGMDVTIYDFLKRYLTVATPADAQTSTLSTRGLLAHYYAERMLQEKASLMHPPHHLAATAIFASRLVQCQNAVMFPSDTDNPLSAWASLLGATTTTTTIRDCCWSPALQAESDIWGDIGKELLIRLTQDIICPLLIGPQWRSSTGRGLVACKKKFAQTRRRVWCNEEQRAKIVDATAVSSLPPPTLDSPLLSRPPPLPPAPAGNVGNVVNST